MAYTFNPFTGTFDNAPSTLKGDEAYTNVSSNSAFWQDSYTAVATNSAVNWNYQGTDIKDLSSNWQNAYLNQTNYLPLSGGTVTGSLSVSGVTEFGDSLTATTTMFVDANKVGINTETPNEELTVVGNISASETIFMSGARVVAGYSQDAFPVYNIRALTQAEYNAVDPKDNNTIYFITQ